jgi:hypothetical protein
MIGNYNSLQTSNSHKDIFFIYEGGKKSIQVILFDTLNLLKFQMLLMYMI